MKKTLIAITAAAMLLTAVSCGEKKTDSSDTSSESWELNDEEIRELERKIAYDDVDLASKQIEKYAVPEGWKEISVDGIIIPVPSEVEELKADPGSRRFGDKSKGLYIRTFKAVKWEGGVEFVAAAFPEITAERVKQAFSDLGIEYDGTRLSLFKAALSLSKANKTAENAESFEIAAIAKSNAFAITKEVLVSESDGHPIYIEVVDDLGLKNRKPSVNADFFVDENTVYTVGVNAETMDEVLQIATNLKLEEQG